MMQNQRETKDEFSEQGGKNNTLAQTNKTDLTLKNKIKEFFKKTSHKEKTLKEIRAVTKLLK